MRKELGLFLSVLLMSLTLVGCEVEVEEETSKEDKFSIDTKNELQGKIGGDNWRYTQAIAKKSVFNDDEYKFEFYDEEIENPCSHYSPKNFAFYTGKLHFETTQFNLSNTMTLYQNNNGENLNMIITNGYIKIDSIEDDVVNVTVKALFDKKNYLGGKVEVQICE